MDLGGFELFEVFIDALMFDPNATILTEPAIEVTLEDESIQALLDEGAVEEAKQEMTEMLTETYSDEDATEKAEAAIDELVANGEVEPDDDPNPLAFF